MNTNADQTGQSRECGQTLIMFVLFMFVVILFVGLGVDLGFTYITRARLSKSVDAACLMGMRYYTSTTQSKAEDMARSVFAANYGKSGRDVGPVTPSVTFGVSAANNITLDINATTTINTFFIRVLPQWRRLVVGSAAQATRPNLIMTLVLDRSGSMDPNRAGGSGGGAFLPSAVTTFINNFDDVFDKAAMVRFSTVQNDVVFAGTTQHQPKQPFKQEIVNAVNAFTWVGATFSQGGLTNALVMEKNATVSTNERVVKVVVFFTDGLANTVQDTLNCPAPRLLNFGGYDAGSTVGRFDPATGNDVTCGATSFRSAIDGTMKSLVRANVSADAEFRSFQVADDMRANKIVVYSIGVGNGINETFLAQIANDPSLAGTAGYTPTAYDGVSIVANDPAEFQAVFQTIADKILLRLSK